MYYGDSARDALVMVALEVEAVTLAAELRAGMSPGLRSDPVCWLVLTAALGRLRAKYGVLVVPPSAP